MLDGAPLAELKPDGVQFPLLRQALAASGHRLAATFTDDAAEIGLVASADYAGRSPALNRAMLAR